MRGLAIMLMKKKAGKEEDKKHDEEMPEEEGMEGSEGGDPGFEAHADDVFDALVDKDRKRFGEALKMLVDYCA